MALGHPQGQLVDLAEASADEDRGVGELAFLQGFFQLGILLPQLLLLEGVLDQGGEFFLGEGLGQVVVGAELHRFDRRFDGAVPGHHDHRHLRLELLDPAQGLDPIQFRHLDVEQQQIPGRFSLLEDPQHLERAPVGRDLVAPAAEHLGEVLAHPLFVVTDDDPVSHSCSSFKINGTPPL